VKRLDPPLASFASLGAPELRRERDALPRRFAAALALSWLLAIGPMSAQEIPDAPPAAGNLLKPGDADEPRAGSAGSADPPETAPARVPPEPRPRPFAEIPPSADRPEVRALAKLDETHVVFLNQRGQIGVAKFSPGLSLIGWQLYSGLASQSLPQLALGPDHSVVYASPWELTQAFDTEARGKLDFHQALARDWLGRDDGVTITAGPVADPYGRLLYALAPHSYEDGEEPVARIYAWHPETSDPVPVTESHLPVVAFTLSRQGALAALLDFPGYEEGYYVSVTDLPAFHPDDPDAVPDPLPETQPSLLVPASLTGRMPLRQLAFFHEEGQEKLLALAPDTGAIVEILPSRPREHWQGGIFLRQIVTAPVRPLALAEMAPGQLLAGGEGGFARLELDPEVFRIMSVELASDGLVLVFSEELDRAAAIAPDRYRLRATSLDGGGSDVPVVPVVEREGRTLVLKAGPFASRTVLRIACDGLLSASGRRLLSDTAYFVINDH